MPFVKYTHPNFYCCYYWGKIFWHTVNVTRVLVKRFNTLLKGFCLIYLNISYQLPLSGVRAACQTIVSKFGRTAVK